MRKLLLLLSLCFTVYLSTSAQVKIREEVVVEPSKKKITSLKNTITTSPYSFQFNISVDNPSADTYVAMIYGNGNVSGGGEWGSTSLSVSNVLPDVFLFQFRINSSTATTVEYQLIFDGDVAAADTVQMPAATSNVPYFNVQYTPPISSDFILDMGSVGDCASQSVELEAITSDTLTTCWHRNKDLVNLSFSSGGDLMSFAIYVPNYPISVIGKTAQVYYSTMEYIIIIPDDLSSIQDDQPVTVNANINGIEHSTTTYISLPNKTITYSFQGFPELYYSNACGVNYEVDIGGQTCPSYEIPNDLSVDAEIIRGSEFVNLYDLRDDTFTQYKVITDLPPSGTFLVASDAHPATQVDTAIVRLTTNHSAIEPVEVIFTIYPPELKIVASPAAISPGESTQLSFLQLDLNGNYVDFPPDQIFLIYNDTPEYGILYDSQGDSTSNFLVTDPSGVIFISDSMITEDTVFASIYVETVVEDGGGIGVGITNLGGDGIERTELFERDGNDAYKESTIAKEKLNNFLKEKKFISQYRSPKLSKLLLAKQKESKKISSKKNQVTFGTRWIAGEITVPIIKKEVDSLKIITPEIEEDSVYFISKTPEMPSIECRAKFSGGDLPENQIATWNCTVSYDYPPGSDEETYNEEITFDSDNITQWNLNFNNGDPIVGGKVTIWVTTTIDDEQYADTIIVYIRGENPENTDVEAQTDDGQLAMIETEVPNYAQFRTENYAEPNEGLPLRGGDRHGWGLCQIDDRWHNITTAILWEWTANLEYGLDYYNDQRVGAEDRLENAGDLNTPPEGYTRQSMIDIEGYARYNGGPSARVWRWIPPNLDQNIPGHWVRDVTSRQQQDDGTWRREYHPDIDQHSINYEGNYSN